MHTVAVLGIVLLTVLSIGRFITNKTITPPINKEVVTTSIPKSAQALDIDKDGISDWEEKVRGTDPRSIDTDLDGISDALEIMEGGNPLVKEKTNTANTINNNLPKETIAEYDKKNPKSAGVEGVLKEMIENTLSKQAVTKNSGGEQIIAEKISALKSYGNALGALLTNRLSASAGQAEATYFESAIKTPSAESLEKLKIVADKYKGLSQTMDTLRIPTDVLSNHAKLKDAYLNQSEAILKLLESTKDNAIPPESFVPYTDTVVGSGRAFIDIANFLKTMGVTFNKNDAGSIFMMSQ